MEETVVEGLKFQAVKPEHADKWVAIARKTGRLLAAGDTLAEVVASSKNDKDKTIFKVMASPYVGG